jgi:glycosyltransferase involved in cell wall biosynthesis/predicted GNAT family N-acyltransferase
MRPRIAHVTTVDVSLRFLLLGQLRRLRDEGFEVVGISAPGPWVPDLEREGIRHIPWINATRSWDPASDAKAFGELVGILRRGRFDLVHTHNPKPGILGRVAARVAGVPCVVNTVHGFYARPEDPIPKRAAVMGLEWAAARFSDLELYQSGEDLRWARHLRVARAPKAVLLGNGTDLSMFDPARVSHERVDSLRRELGLDPGRLVVGTVGRMVVEKGYRELFEAARRVRSVMPEAAFLVVGEVDAEKGDALGQEEIGAAMADVTFAGWREDVRDLLALMDLFVLASWREGMPRSAIEAAAMGRPLVLTDIRGCREIVRDGVGGVLVPPKDPGELAEAILALLRDPERRARVGADARRVAVERFDERRVADLVVDHTRRLLRRKGRQLPADGTVIRAARARDVASLARLHRLSMPEAFLPTLGDPFLRQLYRAAVADPEAVTVVAERRGRVVGFAAAVPSIRRFYLRFLRTRGIAAALVAAPRLLRRDVVRRVWETARYPSGSPALPDAELLSIAVAPEVRTGGIGGSLARRSLDELAARGVGKVKVVVGAENEPANRFYERIGFEPVDRIRLHEGTVSNVLVATCRS